MTDQYHMSTVRIHISKMEKNVSRSQESFHF